MFCTLVLLFRLILRKYDHLNCAGADWAEDKIIFEELQGAYV